MNIAICDDEPIILKQTTIIVKRVFDEKRLKYNIYEYTDVNRFMSEDIKFDIVFLDIELNNEYFNGVLAAKQLKSNNPECMIIFITNYEEYIDDVIEKYAFRYWAKPIDEYRLRKAVDVIIKRVETIKIEDHETKKHIQIMFKNIIYITPSKRHCEIYTVNGKYTAEETFKELKMRFYMDYFCDCHGSYCVNLNYVSKYDNNEVVLKYGDLKYKVHMSRRYYKEFKEKMFIMGGGKV